MPEPLALRTAPAADTSTDFEALVGPWVAQMYRLAAGIVGVDGAEEVTQESLLDAWRGLGRLRNREAVRPWLNSIVVNRASKFLRAQRSRPRSIAFDIGDMPGARVAPDHSLSVVERDRLDRAFNSLNAEQRACVVMHYALDLTVPSIAETLRIPSGTVKSRINAGVERLRLALEDGDR